MLVGYRWYNRRGIEPAFAFGHGLSYTRTDFRDLHVRRRGKGAVVSITVRNVGRRAGVAVPQLYLGLPDAVGRVQPPRQLKGFESVSLRRGDRARVRFVLDGRAFSSWNARRDRWQVAPGCYQVEVGRSSTDVVARAEIAMNGGRCR